jgi:3-hydroxyisobutyrate dehydrogenase-like beta-hydroxyacid dehydrogenase
MKMNATHPERIGFIGVGLMGHGMAKNIVEKGYGLTVMAHRNRAPVEDLIGRGAREGRTPAEIARASDVIFLCVTGSTQVEGVLRGPDGIKAGAKPGLIVVDCSTSDPTSTLALAAELREAGITLVDAPLSRTPKEAWEGKLDTMVGADEATFARLKPVIETWAGRIVHVGGVGDGHKMKLLNNFLAMGYAALYSEALVLAQKVGLSPQRFDAVIRNGRMDCGFYQSFMGYTLEGNREVHRFTLANAFKDMRYLESMADSVGMANPMGNAVKNNYALAVNAGRAELYVPMLIETIAEANGVEMPIPRRE